jgi:GNAT superfamily N-acetyltransferase
MSALEPLTPAHHEGAARVLADAFMDDPGWVGVGPKQPTRRWRFIYRTCLATIRVGERWCGPSWCITEPAGPAVLARSLRAERIFEKAHPTYDHFLVWLFGVSPSRQRSGLGRRLMSEALSRADADEVPAYLWTANPDNLPYYRSHGYEVIGECTIPGGASNWYMQRPPPSAS